MASFVKRKIEMAVQLASNSGTNQPNAFAESGTNTVTLKGLRTRVRIQNSGSPADCRSQVQVYGMSASLMNQLSTLGLVFNLVPKNTLTITAGDEGGALTTVFSGTIYSAYGDYASQPDVPFHFECLSGVASAVAPAPVSSFTGSTSVETIMSGLARQMNLGFENNGVDIQLASPYLSGSLWVQAQKVAEHAGINWGVFNGQTLAIWKKGGNRDTPDVPLISPATGMIGYPAFTQQGIIVKTLFNPRVSFGQLIKVESDLLSGISAAQKKNAAPNTSIFPTQWAVNKLDLLLDTETPKGDWQSVVYAYNPSYSKAIIPPAGAAAGT
jgi:hypothetical protein